MTGAVTGVGTMVRLVLRRDRVRLPIWVLGIVGLVYGSAGAVAQAYSTPQQIQAYGATMGSSPAAIAMAGPPVALDTIGGILIYETSATALIATALMAVFLMVRHTRTEEEEGRTELLRSTVLGRHAPMAAALVVVSVACVLVGVGVAAAFTTVDVDPAGALLFGASVAVFGIVFAAVAAAAAQVMTHGRGAVGVSASVLGVSFLLRAVGDVREGVLTWVSPMGWSQAVHAFAENRWWPLALSLVAAVALTGASVVLATRRDLGAGIVPPRPGPASAAPSLSGPVGLAARLQRGLVIGWAVGLFVGGASFGSFSREVQAMVESNPTLAEYFAQSGGASLVDTYLSTATFLLAVLAGGFAVGSALRLRGEESSGRLEPVLATGVSRTRWLLGGVTVTVVGSLVVMTAAGAGLGLAHGVVSEDLSQLPRLVGLTWAFVPAVLVLAGLTVLLFGLVSRWAMAAWAVLVGCFLVGYLGPLLRIPAWVTDLSPFSHVPAVPAEAVTALPLVVLAAVAVGAGAVGLLGFRRRDAVSA